MFRTLRAHTRISDIKLKLVASKGSNFIGWERDSPMAFWLLACSREAESPEEGFTSPPHPACLGLCFWSLRACWRPDLAHRGSTWGQVFQHVPAVLHVQCPVAAAAVILSWGLEAPNQPEFPERTSGVQLGRDLQEPSPRPSPCLPFMSHWCWGASEPGQGNSSSPTAWECCCIF